MKYAVITDVHSNVFALRAALREIDKLRTDKIICLGDLVGNGFYPEETVSLIRERGDVLCVKGNHDFFVTADLRRFSEDDPRVKVFRWQQKVLSTASKNFLSRLPLELNFTDGDYSITAFHYPLTPKGRFKDMKYLPSEEDLKILFGDRKGDIFLFGHEHTGSLNCFDGKYYLNFGTTGNFLEKDAARFGILDIDGKKVGYKAINAYYDDSLARKSTEMLNGILNKENKNKSGFNL